MRFRHFLAAIVCPCFSLFAQKPLSINDFVPNLEFEKLLNYPKQTAKLSDFKEPLILLDFWATWCTSCLHSFPKLDSLQSEFEGKVKVILVNSRSSFDDLPKVQSFFTKWERRTGKKLCLTTAVEDSIAEQAFPHHFIPHYVWIYKGKFVAATSAAEVTEMNIREMMEGTVPRMTLKKDQDTDRPLFSNTDLPMDSLLQYSVFVKGWFDGLGGGSHQRMKGNITYGRALTNTALLDMYKVAVRGIAPAFNEKQFIVAKNDSGELVPPPSGDEREAWFKKHAYSLDVILPVEQADRLYPSILEVLNRNSGYKGYFDERTVICWVLSGHPQNLESKGKSMENKLSDQTGPNLKNGTMELLVSYLNDILPSNQYMIDETRYTGKIDILFPKGSTDIETMREQLQQHGLNLRQEERKLRVFVIQKE